ncbi:MAG: flavin-nucleotide-binding protein [Symploca sp. SIO2C1]|nr:flavin-nucleotide-binding protein [Symploca sp. SIO2C1]
MVNPGWASSDSPFHAGELAIQARFNIHERMDKQGRRVIRDYLPEQFRQFFAQLPYVIVGTVDAEGKPWASILVGEPGFLSTPDKYSLRVSAQPLFGDPLTKILATNIDIGFLGIELHTRRRNRLNGTVSSTDGNVFEVKVQQSFGNCPQYIQARTAELGEFLPGAPKSVDEFTVLSGIDKAIINASDTFFIATAYQAKLAGAASGVDVSHRGGKPGFVRVDGDSTLTIPDFSGNFHFNTFGNLELNPRAGLLFVDFDQGDLLYLTGTAEVIWEGAEIADYEGAERLLRFHLEQGYRVEQSLPLHWSAPTFSPFLERMGS